MQSDRELLELAAKAAGLDLEPTGNEEGRASFGGDGLYKYSIGGFVTWKWRPLTDDGDALRLAVKLNLWAAVRDGHHHLDSDGDFYAATRRAITRAAAQLAQAQEGK